MATHDYVIANGTGAAVRSDLNNALAAIVSNNSSSTEPGTTYAYQWWADTNANVLKLRNSANDGWITLRELDGTMLIEDGSAATPGLAFADDVNTGIFSPAADAVAFSTGGTERVRITSTGAIAIEGASNYGTSGQILTSNGNDAPTWQDAASSTSDKIEEGNTNVECVDTGTDGHILFDTEGSERARIDNSGRFLLGTNTSSGYSSARLIVNSAGTDSTASGNIVIQRGEANGSISNGDQIGTINFGDESGYSYANITANADLAPGTDSPGRLVFSTTEDSASSATERMRLNSSGQLLVQTTDSTGTQLLKVNGDTSLTTNGGRIALTQGRTSPANGATHGVLSFGTETRPAQVELVGFVDGTWNDGSEHPSGLIINCTADNRSDATERVRITNTGEFNAYGNGSVFQAGTLQGAGTNVYFYEGRRNQNTGGTRTYIVYSNGNVQNTNNSYGSLSDQRLKENIVDATSQWDDIKSLQIRKYNFREATGHETHTQIGLIAQEAESVSPGLVQTTAVAEGETVQDADGNQLESLKSINYSVLYMKSVKALQEAMTRIETLESQQADLLARVTALEAG